jgi:hypothetical protein
MQVSLRRAAAASVLALTLGCPGEPPAVTDLRPANPGGGDMEEPVDTDLGDRPDFRPPPDLTPPPMLTNVPDCAMATVTAEALYTQVARDRCTARYCHGSQDPVANFKFESSAQMRSVWLGRFSTQSGIPFVSSRNLDRSYVIWKLLDQHGRFGPPNMTGSRMPLPPREALSTADLCLFINWIRSGAG